MKYLEWIGYGFWTLVRGFIMASAAFGILTLIIGSGATIALWQFWLMTAAVTAVDSFARIIMEKINERT